MTVTSTDFISLDARPPRAPTEVELTVYTGDIRGSTIVGSVVWDRRNGGWQLVSSTPPAAHGLPDASA